MTSPEQKTENQSEENAHDRELEVVEEVNSEEAAEGDPAEDLSVDARLEKAQEEVARFKDAALRAEAEMQNVRRRAERDVESAYKFGLERFIGNLLPLLDGLEKAVESAEQAANDNGQASDTDKAIVEGVGLCQKMLLDVLAKEGVAIIDPEGQPFDPNLHQAMSIVENPNVEPNSVVAVVQKGYTLNDRLVRPAMVMVSKAPAADG